MYIYIGIGAGRGGTGSREGGHWGHVTPPQVFSLCHAHSICPVLQTKNCAPQLKSLSYTSDI